MPGPSPKISVWEMARMKLIAWTQISAPNAIAPSMSSPPQPGPAGEDPPSPAADRPHRIRENKDRGQHASEHQRQPVRLHRAVAQQSRDNEPPSEQDCDSQQGRREQRLARLCGRPAVRDRFDGRRRLFDDVFGPQQFVLHSSSRSVPHVMGIRFTRCIPGRACVTRRTAVGW